MQLSDWLRSRGLRRERAADDLAVAPENSLILTADQHAQRSRIARANRDTALRAERYAVVATQLALDRALAVDQHTNPDRTKRHDLHLDAAGRSWPGRGRDAWRPCGWCRHGRMGDGRGG